jgi:thiol-disulfide isomerase/thioredoxin/outer membrane lipoprotein-sorting protein
VTRFYRYFTCVLLLLTLWQVSPCQKFAKPAEKPLNRPGEDADFQRYLNSGRISVVAFYADWCPSCRSWAPILDAVNTYFPDMQVLFMDIGEWDTPVTEQYGFQSIPHFKIYDGAGRSIVEGSAAKDWLRQQIKARFQARARGEYRFNGDPGSVKFNDAARSVTTRPPKGAAGTRSRASSVPSAREKIDSTGQLPSVDQVITRYFEALGKTSGAAKFSTRTGTGKVEISKLGRGSFTTHAKAPNKVAVIIEIPEVGVIKQGFNGATGWIQNPRSSPRPATEAELVILKRDADIDSLSSLKARYPKMKLLGVSKIGYREAYVVEAKPQAGHPERLYFSKENGLLIRWDAVLVAGDVKDLAEIYLDDWTEVDGIKMPFTVTQLLPGLSLVFSFSEVKHDVQLNDDVFNRPRTKVVSLSNRR